MKTKIKITIESNMKLSDKVSKTLNNSLMAVDRINIIIRTFLKI